MTDPSERFQSRVEMVDNQRIMAASTMRVFLDDQPCSVAGDTVSKAVAEAAALARANGRMIVEVNVDGRTWTSQQLDAPDHASIIGAEIRMTSAAPLELVQQTLGDASRALDDAASLQQNAAELLQQGHIPDAMQRLQDAIAIWMSVQQAITLVASAASIDMNGTVRGMDVPINELVQRLNDQLRVMHDELQRQDITALADTLLYDFPPVIELWQTLLNGLLSGAGELATRKQ